MNPAVRHLSGWETTDLINKPLSQVIELPAHSGHEEHTLESALSQAMSEGHDLRAQPAMIKNKQGHQIPVVFSMFPLSDQDKVVGGVVTIQTTSTPPAAKA